MTCVVGMEVEVSVAVTTVPGEVVRVIVRGVLLGVGVAVTAVTVPGKVVTSTMIGVSLGVGVTVTET